MFPCQCQQVRQIRSTNGQDVTMNDDSTTQSERDQVADLLDNLLQVIAEGTRGGLQRVPTRERLQGSEWSARYGELETETEASIRMLKAKNVRAVARARQATKRRGIRKG